MSLSALELTTDQKAALHGIIPALRRGERVLLSGSAGTGKTWLMQRLAKDLTAAGKTVVLTAPTHKAVAVLARKIAEAKIKDVPCRTIHSLLSLKPKPYGDRLVFERARRAEPVTADVVVIDECSMLSAEMMAHVRRHLPMAAVLFVGDPAQLPPVNEPESQSFATKPRFHLSTIVRQAADNPILAAAHTIRESQGRDLDWSWCKSANKPPFGVFMPRGSADEWMKKAFTSEEFDADPDSFRALGWTNAWVAEVNSQVRRWRYGDNVSTPFMVGEMAMFRAPVIQDRAILFNTNEEAKVLEIKAASYRHKFIECEGAPSWTADIPTWRITLKTADGIETAVHMASHDRSYNGVIDKVKDEAEYARIRWKHLHEFRGSIANLQSVYSLTVHNSQGSTFGSVFVNIPNIRQNPNTLEQQQMCYVAVTRASKSLMLTGI